MDAYGISGDLTKNYEEVFDMASNALAHSVKQDAKSKNFLTGKKKLEELKKLEEFRKPKNPIPGHRSVLYERIKEREVQASEAFADAAEAMAKTALQSAKDAGDNEGGLLKEVSKVHDAADFVEFALPGSEKAKAAEQLATDADRVKGDFLAKKREAKGSSISLTKDTMKSMIDPCELVINHQVSTLTEVDFRDLNRNQALFDATAGELNEASTEFSNALKMDEEDITAKTRDYEKFDDYFKYLQANFIDQRKRILDHYLSKTSTNPDDKPICENFHDYIQSALADVSARIPPLNSKLDDIQPIAQSLLDILKGSILKQQATRIRTINYVDIDRTFNFTCTSIALALTWGAIPEDEMDDLKGAFQAFASEFTQNKLALREAELETHNASLKIARAVQCTIGAVPELDNANLAIQHAGKLLRDTEPVVTRIADQISAVKAELARITALTDEEILAENISIRDRAQKSFDTGKFALERYAEYWKAFVGNGRKESAETKILYDGVKTKLGKAHERINADDNNINNLLSRFQGEEGLTSDETEAKTKEIKLIQLFVNTLWRFHELDSSGIKTEYYYSDQLIRTGIINDAAFAQIDDELFSPISRAVMAVQDRISAVNELTRFHVDVIEDDIDENYKGEYLDVNIHNLAWVVTEAIKSSARQYDVLKTLEGDQFEPDLRLIMRSRGDSPTIEKLSEIMHKTGYRLILASALKMIPLGQESRISELARKISNISMNWYKHLIKNYQHQIFDFYVQLIVRQVNIKIEIALCKAQIYRLDLAIQYAEDKKMTVESHSSVALTHLNDIPDVILEYTTEMRDFRENMRASVENNAKQIQRLQKQRDTQVERIKAYENSLEVVKYECLTFSNSIFDEVNEAIATITTKFDELIDDSLSDARQKCKDAPDQTSNMNSAVKRCFDNVSEKIQISSKELLKIVPPSPVSKNYLRTARNYLNSWWEELSIILFSVGDKGGTTRPIEGGDTTGGSSADRTELDDVKRELRKTKKALEKANEGRETAETQLEEANEEIGKLKKNITDLRGDLTKAGTDASEAERDHRRAIAAAVRQAKKDAVDAERDRVKKKGGAGAAAAPAEKAVELAAEYPDHTQALQAVLDEINAMDLTILSIETTKFESIENGILECESENNPVMVDEIDKRFTTLSNLIRKLMDNSRITYEYIQKVNKDLKDKDDELKAEKTNAETLEKDKEDLEETLKGVKTRKKHYKDKYIEETEKSLALNIQLGAGRAYIQRLQAWGSAMQGEAVRQYDVSKKIQEFYGMFYDFLPPKEAQSISAMP